MGNYIGVRDRGRLIAMAGERMCVDGHVEISAVCVDEDYRGNGLAGGLVKVLRRGIEQRGEAPFLHVFSDNISAIRLYDRLGFQLRRTFYLTRIGHADPGSDAASLSRLAEGGKRVIGGNDRRLPMLLLRLRHSSFPSLQPMKQTHHVQNYSDYRG
jgi:ribosomal protein S18 acetylase RimI-like enzyme